MSSDAAPKARGGCGVLGERVCEVCCSSDTPPPPPARPQERTLAQRLGQSFNSAGIALFARVAWVSREERA